MTFTHWPQGSTSPWPRTEIEAETETDPYADDDVTGVLDAWQRAATSPRPAPTYSDSTEPIAAPARSTDDKLGPQSWDDYVGQPALKARLDAHITAALIENRPLEHILLDGPAGAGKTTIARIIAARLGDPLMELNRPVSTRQLVDTLFELSAGVLFIDEIQSWSKAQREGLLGLLEEGRLTTDWGTMEIPHLTVVAATTERGQLGGPLEDRFLIQTWETYRPDELAAIVEGMAQRAGVTLGAGVVEGIVAASCGSPRQCRHLVKVARALSYVDPDHPVSLDRILGHAQIEADGLGRAEMSYLQLLSRNASPVGLEVITDTLGLHRTRVRAIERLLVERNLVLRTKSGRTLTAAGRRRTSGDRQPPRARRPVSAIEETS